ncbi:MAG: ribonuclease H-like domain-containing protein, partial [Rhodoglobus sp.]
LYSEQRDGSPAWNLDYLFGLVDRDEKFSAFWAHSLDEEKTALIEFLEFLRERLTQHPGMHVYHYASYERTHLLSLAARHGVGETFVDELLRAGVLVDLYPLVRKSVRVGGRSYSIKKLEPLYMGDELRAEDGVTTAGDSVEQYNQFRSARDAGDATLADGILSDIADYNRYDCVSTLRLHAWLLALAAESGHHPGTTPDDELDRVPFEPSPIADALVARSLVAREAGDLDGAVAYDLASAAVDFHRREDKSFWWEHYARLSEPDDEWLDTKDVFAVESAVVLEQWQLARTASHRVLQLQGSWAPGSRGETPRAFAVYPDPGVPYRDPKTPASYRLAVSVTDVSTDDEEVVTIYESSPGGREPWEEVPMAIAPGPPPPTENVKAAILEIAERLDIGGPGKNAIDDILWRQPSRTRSGALTPAPNPDDLIAAVTASTLDLDSSYVAVQGPPGTGKTYLAAHVIRNLVVDHGWKIGVTAQSHKAVENVLRTLVTEAELDADLVGKAPGEGGDYSDEPFTALVKDRQAEFAAQRDATGYVLGGTVWNFTNPKRVNRGQLDLLVIDEAGQFSLANTVAGSAAARNLLLLGDPQQLEQVSQGTHPAPVNQSALGFIANGHAVLPAEFGYFLPLSWRMHSAVAAPISVLAYDGALASHPSADDRMLAGIDPGLHPVAVDHVGNATSSTEEADHVVALVDQHLGRAWTDKGVTRPLGQDDVIVVTPYNAQVETIRLALDAAGHLDVRVGT